MQPDRTPVTLLLAVIVFNIVFGIAVLRDVFFSTDSSSQRKPEVFSTAASAPLHSKSTKSVPDNSTTPATAPFDLKEPRTVRAPEETVSKPPQDSVSVAPSEKSQQRGKAATDLRLDPTPELSPGTVKSLRSDDRRLPTADLRSGTDAQPLGSLRSPAESNITENLRADEQTLPLGSLRQDERSLPTGSLR